MLQSWYCMSCPKHITEAMQEVMTFLTSLLSAQQRRKLQPSVCSISSAHSECLHGAPATHQVLSPWMKEICPSAIKTSFFKTQCAPVVCFCQIHCSIFFIPFLLFLIQKFQIPIPGYWVARDMASEEKDMLYYSISVPPSLP